MIRGRFEVPDGVVDGVIAVGVAAALLSTGMSGRHSASGLDPLGLALLVTGGLALAARRRAPPPLRRT
ncbi:hypothetical protein [Streptomyces sp. NPDC056194]|uniref:hypothetical protein n=1 Tax=unclassified Streptomyces TaxID=2593676 RepID=UPI0035E010A5